MSRLNTVALMLLACLACLALTSNALAGDVLLIIDSSASMGEVTADGIRRIDASRKAVPSIVSKLSGHEVGMVLFGHRIGANQPDCCGDVELHIPFGPVSSGSFSDAVARLEPRGKTPLAKAFEEAETALMSRKADVQKTVIVLTDGAETCGGDPASIVRRMRSLGINVTVHVVGFDVSDTESTQLQQIATAGGGEYRRADNLDGLLKAFDVVAETVRNDAPARLSRIESALVTRLTDEDPYVRQSAAVSLMKRNCSAAAPALTQRVADGAFVSWAKDSALTSLAHVAPQEVVGALLHAVQTEEVNVRNWAVAHLGTHGGPIAAEGLSAVDQVLTERLLDENAYVRQSAARSLQVRTVRLAVPQLAQRVTDETFVSWSKDTAYVALQSLSADAAETALLDALDAKNSSVRSWATAKLSEIE